MKVKYSYEEMIEHMDTHADGHIIVMDLVTDPRTAMRTHVPQNRSTQSMRCSATSETIEEEAYRLGVASQTPHILCL